MVLAEDFIASATVPLVILGAVTGVAVLGAVAIRINRHLTVRELRRPVSVLFLGPKESGKTVLLLALHCQMQFRNQSGVRYDTGDRALSNKLLNTLLAMTRPNAPMPNATLERPSSLRDRQITATVRVGSRERAIATFETADYSGELLEEVLDSEAPNEEAAEQMSQTEVTFGLLDGADIAVIMEGGPHAAEAHDRFRHNLARVIVLLIRNPHVSHLVITKWDRLNTKYSFGDVLFFLDGLPQYRQFVANEPGLRVIPVSAVGNEFFAAGSSGGADIHPINMEVLLALAFVHAGRRRLTGDTAPPTATSQSWLGRVRDAFLVNSSVSLNFGVLSLQYQLKRPGSVNGRFRMPKGVAEGKALRSADDAYQFMFGQCYTQVRRFDKEFPESEVRNFNFRARGV